MRATHAKWVGRPCTAAGSAGWREERAGGEAWEWDVVGMANEKPTQSLAEGGDLRVQKYLGAGPGEGLRLAEVVRRRAIDGRMERLKMEQSSERRMQLRVVVNAKLTTAMPMMRWGIQTGGERWARGGAMQGVERRHNILRP